MAKLSILAGATSQSVNLFIQDSSSTTGAGLTGLAYNTASLVCYYTFAGANATSTAVTLATLSLVTSAYSSGGFKEIDATNMPGLYRFDIPNAALATSKGRSVTFMLKGATNMAPCVLEIELTAVDNQSATSFITGINSLAPPTNWNLMVVDASGRVDVGQTLGHAVTVDSNNVLNVSTKYLAGTSCTGRDIGASVLLSNGTGAGQISLSSGTVTVGTNNDKTGYSLSQTFPSNFSSMAISAGGGVAPDWANIKSPTTTVDLSGTTIKNLDSNTVQTGDAYGFLTAALTEAYASKGSAPTLAEILYEIRSRLCEMSVSSTTLTTKKIDGTTTAETFTLSDATAPTSITRAT